MALDSDIIFAPDSFVTRNAVRAALYAYGVAPHLVDGLTAYLLDGAIPGSFLQAVLANDLADAVLRADPLSLGSLLFIVRFLMNETPSICHGSRETLSMWCDQQQAYLKRDQIEAVRTRLVAAAAR